MQPLRRMQLGIDRLGMRGEMRAGNGLCPIWKKLCWGHGRKWGGVGPGRVVLTKKIAPILSRVTHDGC